MHPKTRLTLDLCKSFFRFENKVTRLAAIGAYGISAIGRFPALNRWRARHPLHAYLLLTTRCSMSCEDCFFVDVINDKKVGRLDFEMSQIEENFKKSVI